MNNKIKNYVDVLFSDVPGTKKARELKEEILSNMSERFEDYMSQGKTENQAYSLAVSSMGDIDEMLEEVMPNEEFVKKGETYRKRNARNKAIGVALYLIGAAVLIGFGEFGDFVGSDDLYGAIGLVIFLLIAAVATGLIVYTRQSTPPEYKDFEEQTQSRHSKLLDKDYRIYKSIMSVYWLFITFLYLAVSFITMAWNITWLIWILAGVLSAIIKTLFEMRRCDD